MGNTLASGSVALTDATFSTAISSCLGESEAAAVDGLCTSYGVASGFGAMPDWDVGEVTNMESAFFNKNNFNAPIGNWNTSQVTDMSGMFESASEFNQDISSWPVASVVNMESMFSSASSFNQDITGWSSPSLTTSTSTDMFLSTTAWLGTFARIDGQDTTDGPPSMWGEPCGNGWYDANFQEECEPIVKGIEVKGCDPIMCKPSENWKCGDPSLLRPSDDFDSAEFSYSCTCDNPAGTYATPDLDCARTNCIYPERCLANGRGCAPGAGGNACDRCLTAADIAELPLNERSNLNKAGYYKTGQTCEPDDTEDDDVGKLVGVVIILCVVITAIVITSCYCARCGCFSYRRMQFIGPVATRPQPPPQVVFVQQAQTPRQTTSFAPAPQAPPSAVESYYPSV